MVIALRKVGITVRLALTQWPHDYWVVTAAKVYHFGKSVFVNLTKGELYLTPFWLKCIKGIEPKLL